MQTEPICTDGKLQYKYPGGDGGIVEEVMAGTDETVENVDEQDQEEEEAMLLCECTEKMCLAFPDAGCISLLSLQHQLWLFWGYLQQTQVPSLQQSTLNSYWT